jgi:hypothetical protein
MAARTANVRARLQSPDPTLPKRYKSRYFQGKHRENRACAGTVTTFCEVVFGPTHLVFDLLITCSQAGIDDLVK